VKIIHLLHLLSIILGKDCTVEDIQEGRPFFGGSRAGQTTLHTIKSCLAENYNGEITRIPMFNLYPLGKPGRERPLHLDFMRYMVHCLRPLILVTLGLDPARAARGG
jgi:hypothetical protein